MKAQAPVDDRAEQCPGSSDPWHRPQQLREPRADGSTRAETHSSALFPCPAGEVVSCKEGSGSAAASSGSSTRAAEEGKAEAGPGSAKRWMDALVVLTMIKHDQGGGQGTEVVQEVLWGLLVEDWLEITSSFSPACERGCWLWWSPVSGK